MDDSLALEGVIEEFHSLIASEDMNGAEELISAALGREPEYDAFLHFELGKLYQKWNKLSSAVGHFTKAIELTTSARDRVLRLQILEELRATRELQSAQRP